MNHNRSGHVRFMPDNLVHLTLSIEDAPQGIMGWQALPGYSHCGTLRRSVIERILGVMPRPQIGRVVLPPSSGG